MSDQPNEILPIDDVAAYPKAGKRTAYRLATSEKLLAFKLGGRGASGAVICTIGSPAASVRRWWMTTRRGG